MKVFSTLRQQMSSCTWVILASQERDPAFLSPILGPRVSPVLSSPVNGLSSMIPCITRSEEHTSELQSQSNLVCRLLLEKKNTLLALNLTMRDIKSKNVYSRVNSNAATQWRTPERANRIYSAAFANHDRSSCNGNKTPNQ